MRVGRDGLRRVLGGKWGMQSKLIFGVIVGVVMFHCVSALVGYMTWPSTKQSLLGPCSCWGGCWWGGVEVAPTVVGMGGRVGRGV